MFSSKKLITPSLFIKFLLSVIVLQFAFVQTLMSKDTMSKKEAGIDQISDASIDLMDEIQKRTLDYFIKERNPRNGLIRDWAWNKQIPANSMVTVAGTGFALTAYGIGVERGWLDREEAIEMTKIALSFLRDEVEQEHGFFYHFMNFENGTPINSSEVSPIDTALALAGILFAAEYYQDPEITELAHDIANRIDWQWMLNGGKTFAMAWNPKNGFTKTRWANYDESTLLYLLSLGSEAYPIPAETWRAVRRQIGSYGKYKLIQCSPLFTHQYPHLWIDFRNKNDGFADYFENSKQATLAHRQFAIDHKSEYKSYGPHSWGFTATEGPSGYKAYAAPPGWVLHDGTIAPTACISSIAFTPNESIECMNFIYENYKGKIWGRYGFSDSFNVDRKFYSTKVFAINQAPMMIMIENFRSQFVWNVMNRSFWVKRGLDKAGFKEGTIPLKWDMPPKIQIPFVKNLIEIDGSLNDWPETTSIKLNDQFIELGEISGKSDLEGAVHFAWDSNDLYFFAEIHDDSLLFTHSKDQIWRDDLLELFIDPEGDGLFWGKPSDFQIGFRIDPKISDVKTWSWFQGGRDPSATKDVIAKSYVTGNVYRIEGKIKWSFLKVVPRPGLQLGLTPAIHDVDQDQSETKLIWFFRNEKKEKRFELGKLELTR